VSDLVSSLGLPALPALPGVAGVSQLESVLGNVQALAQGATLRVASLSSTSEFTPAAVASTPSTPGAPVATSTGELPRTGGDGATYAVFGVLLLAAALALVRWLRRPVIEL
jgi:LPXTG-motif cell wall-anchored protein